MTVNTLKPVDAYALAKTLSGMDVPADLSLSPSTALLVQFIKHKGLSTSDLHPLFKDHLQQILAVDPAKPFHEALPDRAEKVQTVPELSASRLTDEKLRLAESGGQWAKQYVDWASGVANQTPKAYHLAAAIWMMGIAIARRLVFNASYGAIFPCDYHLVVGISTYFRKSTGITLAEGLIKKYRPHMLLAPPQSREAMLHILTGRQPENWDSLRPYDKKLISDGQAFPAQRGLWIEEISQMFKGMSKRDFMSGLKEMWMEAWDCKDSITQYTKSGGYIYVRNIGLNLIGTSTPSELSISIHDNDWTNGLITRFCLWFPEEDYREVPSLTRNIPPQLMQVWNALHDKLPDPPRDNGIGDDPPEMPKLSVGISNEAYTAMDAYQKELRNLTGEDTGLDERLRTSYGRLHTHAIKFATMSAGFRWIQETGGAGVPSINENDWYWAQSVAEQLRTNIHRALTELGKTYQIVLEDRIYGLLKRNPRGLSKRDIYRTLNADADKVEKSLRRLIEDGEVEEVVDTNVTNGDAGRKTAHYLLASVS